MDLDTQSTCGPTDLHVGVALCENFALVIEVSTSSEGKFDFGPSVSEVKSDGDESEFFVLQLSSDALDLGSVEKEFSDSIGIVTSKRSRVFVG
jgi:hypothetical protein